MVIVKEIKHGRLQSSLIDGSIFVSSEVTPELRKSIFDRVRSNEQSVIVCTTLADEGLDISNLRSLVLAGGGKSSTRALQRVGRVLRPDKGKDYGYVVDIVDDIEYFAEHSERGGKYTRLSRGGVSMTNKRHVKCYICGHEWYTRSSGVYYITCPSCMRKILVKRALL